MARYLITGIAGFVGSWIAKELVARGETVRGIDNLSTGSLTNLKDIEDEIEFLHADLRNADAVDLACRNVDFIFHEAAIASVQQSIDDPIGTSNVNLGGTLNLIVSAQKNHVKRIVFASSSAVYGNQIECPTTEQARLHPLSPYAIDKLSCEQHLANLWPLAGVETVSLRYFNVFGPRQSASSPYSGVIAQFAQRMLTKRDSNSTIFGDGKQSRDFIFITDVVEANMLAMHAPAETVSGKVFNIGSSKSNTIRLTFEAIACMTGYSGNPTFMQARPGDIRCSLASIDAAREAMGFEPATTFADGLHQTVAWYRSQVDSAPATARALPKVARSRQVIPIAMPKPMLTCDDRLITGQEFVEAVHNNELELYYQPILDLSQSVIVGVEALLRWRRADRLLTPSHFIHLAEQKRLVPLIGAWVIEKACEEAAMLHREFRSDLRIAVNISPAQLERRDFIRTVDNALGRTGLPPSCLDLEVTERTLLRDCTGTQQNLFNLRQRGVRIAVDDFGIGYSNMNYLYRFPVDCLKIDQSFVQHKGHARVLDGIVAFARTLGVTTVAEGVETAYQLTHVRSSGCDEAQGYHIARPMPVSEIIQAIRDYESPLRQVAEAKSRFMSIAIPPMLQVGT